jgi:hypothetical protein
MPRSTPPVWLRLDARLAPRKLSSLARSKWQPCSRCWALPTRNDGQASACAVGRQFRIFSRGAHAASRLWGWQASCQTRWWRTPNMAGPAEQDRDTASGVVGRLAPAPLETFLCFLRHLHGRAVHTARREGLSSKCRPSKRSAFATCLRLSAFTHAALENSREKQAPCRRRSHRRQATDVGAGCPCTEGRAPRPYEVTLPADGIGKADEHVPSDIMRGALSAQLAITSIRHVSPMALDVVSAVTRTTPVTIA